jgi:putative ABC transport system permease protein
MIVPKLAVRDMLGAGMKTWLNAVVLSLSFVCIIWGQSLFKGMNEEASQAMIAMQVGGGQYWVETYDPLDPFTLDKAHAALPAPLESLAGAGDAAPILLVQGTIYPKGRVLPVQLRGIDPGQTVLQFPSSSLRARPGAVPALLGARMAKSAGLEKGDEVTVRWRDAKGTFDARDLVVAETFTTTLQTIDAGQIWIPLEDLRDMAAAPGEATMAVLRPGLVPPAAPPGWVFRDLGYLKKDFDEFIKVKTIGMSVFYVILMFLALLAVFNTQVLAIFRRRREIGTMMALGITRGRLIGLFTFEGALQSILAVLLGAVYGVPLLALFKAHGWKLPSGQADDFGLTLGNVLYPVYTVGLVVGSALLVFLATAVVSYLPARKISKLKPTEALKGKLT